MKHDRRLLSLLLSTASSFFGPWPSPATAQLLGPEFQVNSYTTSSQYSPAVAPDGSGGFVVVWHSDLQDGSSTGVFGRRFGEAGLPLGVEFQVNTSTLSAQSDPAIAIDGAGNFVVAWESFDGQYNDVFGQRFDSTGGPLGSEFQVNTYTTRSQSFPSVAASGSGDFVVVWQSWWQNTFDDVFGQRYDAGGLPLGSEFQVNTYSTWYQLVPSVVADAAGNFVVVWQSYTDGWNASVNGQRFDAAGLPVGSEFQVNSYTTGDQVLPVMAGDGSGNFVVVWLDSARDGSDSGLFGRRFDSAGVPVGDEFQVNTFTLGSQSRPAVAADGTGNHFVVWQSHFRDGSGLGIMGQRFDSTGLRVGNEFRVNSFTAGNQQSPVVAANGLGEFVVLWESRDQDGSGEGVFGQRVTFPFFYDGFESGDFGGWSSVCNDGDVCP